MLACPVRSSTANAADINPKINVPSSDPTLNRAKVTHSGNILFPLSADAVGLVQKELPVTNGGFRVLVNRDDDRLDVVVAPAFTSCPESHLSQCFDPRRICEVTRHDLRPLERPQLGDPIRFLL